jgi:hypothetical protein
MREERKMYKVLVGTPGGKDSEDRVVGGRMGSEWIFGGLARSVCGVDSVGSGY